MVRDSGMGYDRFSPGEKVTKDGTACHRFPLRDIREENLRVFEGFGPG